MPTRTLRCCSLDEPARLPASALDAADLVDRWAALAEREYLAETHIELTTDDDHYLRFTIHADPGWMLGDLVEERPRIAGAFGLKHHQVHIASGDLRSTFQLTVCRDDPLAYPLPLRHPSVVDGAVRIGPYLDGRGDATFRLHHEGITYPGLVLGGPQTGKTNLAELLAFSAQATMPTTITYIDGRGIPSPRLANLSQTVASGSEAHRPLYALRRTALQRADLLRQARGDRLEVSEANPLQLVIIDEADAVFDHITPTQLASLATLGSRTAVSVVAFLSRPSSLGDSARCAAITYLMSGNCFAFRLLDGVPLGGYAPHPSELPASPGAGVHLPPDGQLPRDFLALHIFAASDSADQIAN